MVPNNLPIRPGYNSRIRCSWATGPKIIILVALSEDWIQKLWPSWPSCAVFWVISMPLLPSRSNVDVSHACHAEVTSMSPNATPATQKTAASQPTTADPAQGRKCHACHAKGRSMPDLHCTKSIKIQLIIASWVWPTPNFPQTTRQNTNTPWHSTFAPLAAGT